ncbi:MAG: adenine phosphoribosyltransferase [Chloroflexi bacterium]|nr:adenine phosphoribosyltransferase [Chloroflexota bacterium]
MDLKKWIRDIPDYPKPGILFRDLTPLMGHPPAFRHVVDSLVDQFRGQALDAVAVIDARGFLFGGPVAYRLSLPLVPLRKANKLPPEVVSVEYALEYGKAKMEMISNALRPAQRVLVIDDLLATGGTAAAAARLIEGRGATVGAFAFVVELTGLKGRAVLKGYEISSLVQY